ncbi:L-iditol 2-dehydrogenase [Salibacterium salarium]|uniref:zinc-dependent alcohol dehydrogenase n=1 Tax=Salibacterium salarium TaxID=284579 RepID=UPI002780A80B|nr:alcohol dehydrogenase catalytic domain-containing protein [Salibacterium salarium]MDQ0298893.1 L-iditol 2-dehydrogenase [Salibacterium salarium]
MYGVALTDKQTLEYQQKTLPPLEHNEILLKVHAIGICGSDLRIFQHGDSRISLPRIIGHEIAGEVVELGSSISRFDIGDRVTLGAHIPCGVCVYCQKNQGHHCVKGHSMGYQVDGGFAEYVVLPGTFVENGSIQKIAATTSYEQACLSEPFSCVLSGLQELQPEPGDTVVVYGAGAIGCMYIAALKRIGVAKVIVIQRSAPRRQKAIEAGADVVINPTSADTLQQVIKETDGQGADSIIITAPSPDAQNEALDLVKKMGDVLIFAGIKNQSSVPLNTNQMMYKQLRVIGTHGAPRASHVEAVKWIDQGLLDFDFFITHSFQLEETAKAFQTADSKEGLKCIVKPHE